MHHWLGIDPEYTKGRLKIGYRKIGKSIFKEGDADYGNFTGLVGVVEAIYHCIISKEIITATVDRDPVKIEEDLRKYMQFVLLEQAIDNKAFSHIMVPRFSFIDPATGKKVDEPDLNYMGSIENIIAPGKDPVIFRREISQIYFEAQNSGKLFLEKGKSVIASKNDKFTTCFDRELNLLLSHRKVDEGIDGEHLTQAIMQKKNDPTQYELNNPKIINLIDTIIKNMNKRYSYSTNIALEIIIYAIRKKIVDFKEILN
jgi:hypothetical protein